jgi:addiction module RelE/StbE family toxin
MTLQWTKSFIKDYQKLPQQLQERVDEKLGFLIEDYRHGSLRTKKVKGSIKGQKVTDLYELSVTMAYRIFYKRAGETYVLLRVGTHTEILGR